jgi:hypothetical protein
MIRTGMFTPSARLTEGASAVITNDYWWPAGVAADPAQIPLCWLSRSIVLRLNRPINHAEVSQVNGVSAREDNDPSIATNGVFPFTATLTTAVDADTANLGHWVVTYFGDPRMHLPVLTVDLMYRTDDQKRFLLRLGVGQRIQLTGVPSTWPQGADHLVIVGVAHDISRVVRRLRFTASALVGSTLGQSGPWFRWGDSRWDGSDVRPF